MAKFVHIHTGVVINSKGKPFKDSGTGPVAMLIRGEVILSENKEDIGSIFEYEKDNLKILSKRDYKSLCKEMA